MFSPFPSFHPFLLQIRIVIKRWCQQGTFWETQHCRIQTLLLYPWTKPKTLRPPSKGRFFLVLHPNNSAAAGRWRGYFKLLEHFVSGTADSQKILLGCLCENFSWVFSVTLQHIRMSRVCKMLDTYCHPRSSKGTEDEVAEQRTRPRRNPLRRTF